MTYNILFKENKGWAIKKRGSLKVIKYYPTKIEALEDAVRIAGNNNAIIKVWRKDGKFQSFQSAKMALNYAKQNKDE